MTRSINVGGNQGRGNPPAYGTEGTLSEPIRRVNVIATCCWIGSAILAGLAVAAYGLWLS